MKFAFVALAIMVQQATPAPSSATSPAALKTIVNVHSGPVCTTLHQLVLPAARHISGVNDAFASIARYRGAYNRAAVGLNGDSQAMSQRGGFAKKAYGLQNGGVLLAAANIDQTGTSILVELHEIDKELQQSYQQYPQGKNANVDALRQRIQNVVDLQRTMANRAIAAAGTLLDNDDSEELKDISSFGRGRPGGPDIFGQTALATPVPLQDVPDPQATLSPDDQAERDPAIGGQVRSYTLRELKFDSVPYVRSNLTAELHDLVPAALAAVRDCDSGH